MFAKNVSGTRRIAAAFCAAAVIVLTWTAAYATPVHRDVTGADLNDLLEATPTAVDSAMTTDFSEGNLSANVVSQAFTDDLGNYLYLFQINNTGTVANGNSVITRFTATSFPDADTTVPLGYLTANIPTAFTLGDQTPFSADVDLVSGPTIGFDFPTANPGYGIPLSVIDLGCSSSVLYVESGLPPGTIMGSIIDGLTVTGPVVGPVTPEPAALSLLALGGIGAVLRRRRR